MTRWLLTALVLLLYVVHQDVWFWRTAHPLFFGILPVGLFYHLCYSLAAALLMWLLVRYAWPSYLEEDVEPIPPQRAQSARWGPRVDRTGDRR